MSIRTKRAAPMTRIAAVDTGSPVTLTNPLVIVPRPGYLAASASRGLKLNREPWWRSSCTERRWTNSSENVSREGLYVTFVMYIASPKASTIHRRSSREHTGELSRTAAGMMMIAIPAQK